MSRLILPGPAIRPAALRCDPSVLLSWSADDALLDARTGQGATFWRAGSATAADALGANYRVGRGAPAWHMAGGARYLRTAAGTNLWWPWALPPQALTLYWRGLWPAVDSTVVCIGGAGPSYVGQLNLRATAAGTASVESVGAGSATLSSSVVVTGVAAGDAVELLGTQGPDGVLQVQARRAGSATRTGAQSTARALEASFASPRANLSGGNPGQAGSDSARLVVLRGCDWTMDSAAGAY